MDKPKNLTGLWKRTSKSGIEYLSAIVDRKKLIEILNSVFTEQVSVMAFRNNKRPGKKDADWQLSVGEVGERPQQRADAPPPGAEDMSPPSDDIPL